MSRWLLVVAAFAAMALSNGAHAHPLAAWIGPLLMVRLVRDATGRSGVALGWLVFVAAWLVGWAGVFRLGLAELAPMALILSGLGFVPFWLDRIVARRLPTLAASLVLPCGNVAVEAGLGLASPFGAWGALGYSQVELLPQAGCWPLPCGSCANSRPPRTPFRRPFSGSGAIPLAMTRRAGRPSPGWA